MPDVANRRRRLPQGAVAPPERAEAANRGGKQSGKQGRGWHTPELVQVDDAALLVDPPATLQELLHSLRLEVLPQVVVAERIVRRQRRRRRIDAEPPFSLLVSEPTPPDHLHLGHWPARGAVITRGRKTNGTRKAAGPTTERPNSHVRPAALHTQPFALQLHPERVLLNKTLSGQRQLRRR
jgi:hypothetical protein